MPRLPANVSVVIPTYNAGEYIDQALESVWNQTICAREIIVVDDCSTDGTAGRVENLALRSNVPLQLIRRDTNSGSPARPMNDGVFHATGDFICVLDQDDVWLPTKLERQSRVLQKMPDASLVYSFFGDLRNTKRTRKLKRVWTRRLIGRMTFDGECYRCSGEKAFDLFVKWENYVAGFPGFMFRRSDWLARGGFDESLAIAADYDFLCWLCSRGSVALVPETHFLRREHGANLTFREVDRLIDVIRILLRYTSRHELHSRHDYRRALASKVVRLAQFFAYCGHHKESLQMLHTYLEVRGGRSWFWKLVRRSQLMGIHLIDQPLGFSNLRHIEPDEATQCISTVERLLVEGSQFLPAQNESENCTTRWSSLAKAA